MRPTTRVPLVFLDVGIPGKVPSVKVASFTIPNHLDASILKGESSCMGKRQSDMIRGTLDMLVLKVLSLEPMHGWGICERIRLISEDELQVNQGSLYPALHKLTQEGWIKSYWGRTEKNRKARYYRLTRAGRQQLSAETAHWDRLAAAVSRVLSTS